VAAECRCDDRETIAEKQRRWVIQSSHPYRNVESSGRVSGGIRKLYIQHYYDSTISFHPPIYRYPVYGSSLGRAVVLVASDTRTAAYGSAYCVVLLARCVAEFDGGGVYVIDSTPPNPLGPGSEDWSYTSILGLGAGKLVLVVGAMVVVVGAVEDADVWLVVESVAERRLTAG
jgi:hypothetical protein